MGKIKTWVGISMQVREFCKELEGQSEFDFDWEDQLNDLDCAIIKFLSSEWGESQANEINPKMGFISSFTKPNEKSER